MTSPAPRPRPSPDPVRQQLREVRRGFFRLHKALIDAERAAFERRQGPVSSGQLLQALIHDPFFAWLRPFSSLLVEIDEALAAREPLSGQSAREYVEQIRGLVEPPEEEVAERYEQIRRHDPDVLIAHVELTSRIAAALE